MSTKTSPPEARSDQTYEAGCHCGYIKFSVTLSPPLPEYEVVQCDCSACRRFGYLLVCTSADCVPESVSDPTREQVQWHGDSWGRLSKYRFNTKQKEQLFCGQCGASIGIDFRDFYAPKKMYGISVRTFNGIDLDTLAYKPFQGGEKVEPAEDLSGIWYDLEQREKVEQPKKEKDEQELAAAAVTV